MKANRALIQAASKVALCFLVTGGVLAQTAPGAGVRIHWRDNMLTVRTPWMPGGGLEVWYLEAFCRKGSTDREWEKTVIPFRTSLLPTSVEGSRIRLRTILDNGVVVMHDLRAGEDEVDFRLTFTNPTPDDADLEWGQPCIRVHEFTGLGQAEYTAKCFLFTKDGMVTLDKTRRRLRARYRGGQVYVPAGIDHRDVNPRPISPDVPVNGLIGCFSADDNHLLAMAWDHVQELFQGVIVCIHSDFRVGGLKSGETKKLHGKLYLMENDITRLLARYYHDFGR